MSPDDSQKQPDPPKTDAMKGAFTAGHSGTSETPMFQPEELDIYVNKVTLEAFIFHGKEVDYTPIDHLEYNNDNYTLTIVRKDKTRQDLGVKIQWLVRTYLKKANEISIVQTKEGESINKCTVPLAHTGER